MKNFFIQNRFVAFLLLSVLVGLTLHAQNGFVLIAIGQWTLQTSIWFAGIFWLLSLFVFYAALRVIFGFLAIPHFILQLMSRFQLQRAEQKMNQGMLDMAQGNWSRAEKNFVRGINFSEGFHLVNYLEAARAAQEQGAITRRDDYLKNAYDHNPESEVAIRLTQAQLQLEQGQTEQALANLTRLREIAPKHSYVLKLLKEVYVKLEDWSQLKEIFPALVRYQFVTSDEKKRFQIQIVQNELKQFMQDPSQLAKVWHDLSRKLQRTPALVLQYSKGLIEEGKSEIAAKLILKTLKYEWDDQLVLCYSQLNLANKKQQLDIAEKWLKQHSKNSALLFALGKICKQNQLWGKARSYLEAGIGIKPTAMAYQELAELFEKLGSNFEAAECYRKTAELS